jgi:hypothetical protein
MRTCIIFLDFKLSPYSECPCFPPGDSPPSEFRSRGITQKKKAYSIAPSYTYSILYSKYTSFWTAVQKLRLIPSKQQKEGLRAKGEEQGTSNIRLFLRDVSVAAGGRLGWAQYGSFYFKRFRGRSKVIVSTELPRLQIKFGLLGICAT